MIVESIIVLVIAAIKITASRFIILFHSSAEVITKQRPKETCWRGIQKEKKRIPSVETHK